MGRNGMVNWPCRFFWVDAMGLLKKILFILFLLALVVFGAVFAIENDARVPLDLLIVELPELRVSVWLVLSFIVGGIAGLVVCGLKLLQLQAQYQGVCRKLAKSEKELTQLKTG